MSEVRRRTNTNDSEGLSETSFEESKKTSDIETDVIELATTDGADSEYETVEESGSESGDTDHVPSNRNSSLEVSEKEDCDNASVILDLERQSGDGEEQEGEKKKVDDDEDRSNPQYIPKRGTFYEHDDRTAEDGLPDGAETKATDVEEEMNQTNEKNVGKAKKVWQQSQDRWSHDRYDEDEQAPKSRSELIAAYGYDIRNEEGPPKARRGHRYGHGPNKYTRNWEDLEAYGKPKISQRKPKPEDFPALRHEKHQQVNDSSETVEYKKSDDKNVVKQKQQNNRVNTNKQSNEFRTRHSRNKYNRPDRSEKQVLLHSENFNKESGDNTVNVNEYDPKNKKNIERHVLNSNVIGERRMTNKPFKNRNTLEFKSQNRNKATNSQITNSQNNDGPINNHFEQALNNEVQKISYDMPDKEDNADNIITQSYSNTKLKNEDMNSTKYSDNNTSIASVSKNATQSSNNNHRNNIPPRMQDSVRPKRYSCQRPGGLCSDSNVQQNQQVYQQNFYGSEYPSAVGNESNNSHQGHISQPLNAISQPGAPVVTANLSVPPPQTLPYVPEAVPTQVMTTSNQVMPQQVLAPQYPPSSIQFNSGGPYMGPNNTFIPQTLGYPVPPPQHSASTQYPPQYPQYPAPATFNAVPNPPAAAPMFQPQGGITYYSPQGQPLPPRLVPRRPRSSAIPIVPPPPQVTQENSSSPTEHSSDNDNVHNIDHILDNMFVQRHPYDPTTSNNISGINEKVQEMSVTDSSNEEVHSSNCSKIGNDNDKAEEKTCTEEVSEVNNDTPTVAT